MRDSIQRKIQLPRVGMRIVKSSIAVFLCFVFYSFFRSNGIIFYSQLAALWCIQPQWENTRSKALQRTVGTLTGAVFGLFVLLIDKRLMGTGLGGELVNTAHLPRRKERDILFISGMDDALLESDHRLSPYSIVELNRMLADGANFTVSTMRTPASLIEPLRGIHLKLPVIAMDGAVMFMTIQPKKQIDRIYEEFQKREAFKKLRISKYDSDDYPGYAYIKIYNENATRENMIAYLREETGLSHIVTFGSIEGKYDILVKECDHNKVVKTLKRMYEPLLWEPELKAK